MTTTENHQHIATEPKFGFALLFFCMIALLLIPGYFEDQETVGAASRWTLSLISIASLYLIAYRFHELLMGIVLVVPTLVINWWSGLLSIQGTAYIASGLYILFLCYIGFFICRFLFETEEISMDMVFAALCLYMYIGLIWMFIYVIAEVNRPGSFSFPTEMPTAPDAYINSLWNNFSYFSFVTLSTLGYGDVTPLSRFTRAWAILEAVIGQLYLAVVVARVVALYIVNRRNNLPRQQTTTLNRLFFLQPIFAIIWISEYNPTHHRNWDHVPPVLYRPKTGFAKPLPTPGTIIVRLGES